VAVDDEFRQTQDLTTQMKRISKTRLLSLLHHNANNNQKRTAAETWPTAPKLKKLAEFCANSGIKIACLEYCIKILTKCKGKYWLTHINWKNFN